MTGARDQVQWIRRCDEYGHRGFGDACTSTRLLPYGSTRVTQQFGTFNEAKQFIFFGLMAILGVYVLGFGQQ